jgi:hypothetical protein
VSNEHRPRKLGETKNVILAISLKETQLMNLTSILGQCCLGGRCVVTSYEPRTGVPITEKSARVKHLLTACALLVACEGLKIASKWVSVDHQNWKVIRGIKISKPDISGSRSSSPGIWPQCALGKSSNVDVCRSLDFRDHEGCENLWTKILLGKDHVLTAFALLVACGHFEKLACGCLRA